MEKLRSTNQIKKSLAQLSDGGDSLDAGPDDGDGVLEGELRGDGGEDNGLPDSFHELQPGGAGSKDQGVTDSL